MQRYYATILCNGIIQPYLVTVLCNCMTLFYATVTVLCTCILKRYCNRIVFCNGIKRPQYDEDESGIFLVKKDHLTLFGSNFFNTRSQELRFLENLVWRICSRFSTSFLEHDYFRTHLVLIPRPRIPKTIPKVKITECYSKTAYQITLDGPFSSQFHRYEALNRIWDENNVV